MKFVCHSPTREIDLFIASKSESTEWWLVFELDTSSSIELKSNLRPLPSSILSVVVIGWVWVVLFIFRSCSSSSSSTTVSVSTNTKKRESYFSIFERSIFVKPSLTLEVLGIFILRILSLRDLIWYDKTNYNNKIKKIKLASQDVAAVWGVVLLHVGWNDEGFVSDVKDDVVEACLCISSWGADGFVGVD